jgi:iturin family lipopeptide synthetase A
LKLLVRPVDPWETPLSRSVRRAPAARRLPMLVDIVARVVAQMAASSPGIGRVSADALWSELGFDSIGLAQLVCALEGALGWRLSPLLPYRNPVLRRFCEAALAERGLGPGHDRPRASARMRSRQEPQAVAVVGLGCRFPGGVDDLERLWQALERGIDSTQVITRWNMDGVYMRASPNGDCHAVRRASLFDDLAAYAGRDHTPEHGLAQAIVTEARRAAGYADMTLARLTTGLFLGWSHEVPRRVGLRVPPWAAVAHVSRACGFRGPSLAIDTTCSSSLFAVHVAMQSLRRRECDVAVAGGVNVIASPRAFIGLSRIGVLAGDGRSRSFDAAASGFGRGEGAAVLALRRLDDAVADRSPILAVIHGSAAGHDGRATTLTAPSREAQARVMRAALREAGVTPDDVMYLEGHGAGTRVGDPVELEAAVDVYGSRHRPLLVGSVKSNLGHCELAAGAAGLLKAIAVVSKRRVPATVHFQRLTPLAHVAPDRLRVPVSAEPWPLSSAGRRLAAVTSMGMSGTNVHVVMEGWNR